MNGSSPPYVLTTFPIGMKPVTTLIGRGVDDLNLVVTYAVGTQLVLAISDLDGSTGRTLPYIFNVVAGYITQCVIPPQVHSTFSFTSNASEETSTAGPWEFRISGGVPPYQLVVTSISSSGSTSVTIFFPDKTYAYFGKGPGSGIVVGTSSS
ncbi:hypothetical protein B0H34DRAFT_396399 [Crassisporium funariophilum]|nr:hypothetical protein B0H34DRAFT_396399 [Crassisporium funariophilum]